MLLRDQEDTPPSVNATSTLGDREYLISAGCRTIIMEPVSFRDPGLIFVGSVTKPNWPVKDS
jgi:hypothetical protein